MEQYLTILGIEEYKNAKYIFKSKKIDILGDGSPLDTTTQIDTWEFEGGYKYLNIVVGVNGEFSTAFSVRYLGESLFDRTKIGDYIGENLINHIELSHMDGFEESDSYYFTSDYENSIKVLKYLLNVLGSLELESTKPKDMSFTVYAPFKAFNQLKDNILENVKDLTDDEEIMEVAEIFMEHHGEDYRSILYTDSRLIFRNSSDQNIADMIEDIMYESFSGDEVLIDDE